MFRAVAAATLCLFFGFAAEANAHPPGHGHGRVVTSWYRHYLQREPDACGLRGWTQELCNGKSEEQVLACILGSQEYYKLHDCCERGFITALYADHLGRRPCAADLRHWTCELRKCGDRVVLARQFLCAARAERRQR